jgi:hypothetical protein
VDVGNGVSVGDGMTEGVTVGGMLVWVVVEEGVMLAGKTVNPEQLEKRNESKIEMRVSLFITYANHTGLRCKGIYGDQRIWPRDSRKNTVL